MKSLFVICAEEDEDYRKQKEQWKLLDSLFTAVSVSMDAITYREIRPASIASDIQELKMMKQYDGILVAAGNHTEEIAGNYAALSGCRCLLGVSDITWEGQTPLFHKYTYQSNMEAVFQLEYPFTIGLAPCIRKGGSISADTKLPERTVPDHLGNRVERTLIKEGGKQKESDILLAVGKGVRCKDDVQKLKTFAMSRGYMFGVTRPVAMSGWAGIDEIIGVSGHIYSPKVCITVGISGSTAFYAGIENSQWIASVNTDEHAPIVHMSDFVVIDDYDNIWEKLSQVL